MRLKRRRGATLGFVAIIVLVLIIIGVGFFVIAKMLGGGRELANSVDAGTLNVAKVAFLQPSKAACEFTNPDVANNFELLSPDGKFRLENYNRLAVQAMIVALNAKDEGTPAAAANARKVWDALNEVSRFLRTSHGSSATMGQHFQNLAGANNLKMLGQNGISLNNYDIAFTARGESTNVFVDPRLLATFSAASSLPLSSGTLKSPTGHQFVAGYAPLTVALSTGTLVFSGVPVNPRDRPHLISGFTFEAGKNPAFMPGYPAEVLPPNTFKSAGQSRESHTQTFGGAVASAIVGALDREYEAGIPNGYIEIKNGPSFPTPTGDVAYTTKDIFSHALAGLGIDMTPNDTWFCRGSDNDVVIGDLKAYDTSVNTLPTDTARLQQEIIDANSSSPHLELQATIAANEIQTATSTWATKNLIDRWVDVNHMGTLAKTYMYGKHVPDCQKSMEHIRHHNGSPATDCREFREIMEYTDCECHWQQFRRDYRHDEQSIRCVAMLPNFKTGYNQFGSSNLNDGGSGWTCLEKFKVDVLKARHNCVTCKTVRPDTEPSGMKRFQHGVKYPAPLNRHNFGQVVSPKRLLEHVDSAPGANGCGLGSTIDFLLRRCQQMKPSLNRDDVIRALNTSDIPLNGTFYLYISNGTLVMTGQKPPGAIAGTLPDGLGGTPATMNCGVAYNVIGTLVNTSSKEMDSLSNAFDLFDNNTSPKVKIAKNQLKDLESNSFSDIPVIDKTMRKVWVDPPGTTGFADQPPYRTDRDEHTDGYFPGWSFRQAQPATCRDAAKWIPSSGYNNLLGQLLFHNECEGGGDFCQPN